MNENIELIEEKQVMSVNYIKKQIYTIRGKQVILDSDVAKLYHYETRRINETVKRNIDRFPSKFCFRLTLDEFNNLMSQFATSSLKEKNKYGGRRKLPLVFTEQGIAMLAPLLKNKIAIQVSINIMDAFIEMKNFLRENGQILERLTKVEYKLLEHDEEFQELYNQIQTNKELTQKIFFNGQIYDAYSLIIDLIQKANKKIVIIDNYVDKTILDMLTKKRGKVEVVIITSTNNKKIQNIDIKKFNIQYPTIKFARKDLFHDRFIIIDNQELYHCGASIKDLGKKCFGINKIEDKKYLEEIVKIILCVN